LILLLLHTSITNWNSSKYWKEIYFCNFRLFQHSHDTYLPLKWNQTTVLIHEDKLLLYLDYLIQDQLLLYLKEMKSKYWKEIYFCNFRLFQHSRDTYLPLKWNQTTVLIHEDKLLLYFGYLIQDQLLMYLKEMKA